MSAYEDIHRVATSGTMTEAELLFLLDIFRAEVRAEALNEGADLAVRTARALGSWGDEASQRDAGVAARLGAELSRMAAAAPVPDESADVEPEFAVRWPDGNLTPATDREHGLRAIASARRADPDAALIQRTCTPWTEVTS